MTDLIRGKVARILSSREIAINVGSNDGVYRGMHFDVMDQNYEEIRDPDTLEILGSIQRPKIRVKITMVQEKLSLASTYKKRKVNVGGAGMEFTGLSRALMPPEWVTRYETLKTKEKTWEDLKAEGQISVQTGDPVVQVSEQAIEIEDEEK